MGDLFVGQSLVHNAQINTVITEYNRWQAAVAAFQHQYNALPGDINNATSFWGSAGGTGSDATCGAVASDTKTCNGDGNGVISVNSNTVFEELRFWQHPAKAKMIEGAFTGTPVGTNSIIGTNIPASKFAGVGWGVDGPGLAGSAYYFTTDYGGGHLFAAGSGGGDSVDQPAFTPKDAWSIDKKVDDGKPGMGSVIAFSWGACSTAANTSDMTGAYKLTDANKDCGLLFLAGF